MNTLAAAPALHSTTSTAGVPTPAGTRAATIERYAAALVRADMAHLQVKATADANVYEVPSATQKNVVYIVTRIGTSAVDLSCTCAGANHIACLHRAAVARYIRQAARCTGYLTPHPAQPGSNCRVYWCEACQDSGN